MENNNVVRVTKAQKLEAIKSFIPEDAFISFPGTIDAKTGVKLKEDYQFSYNEIVAFLDAEIAALAKKNAANNNGKLTDQQKENEAFKELIVDFLAGLSMDDVGRTCSEIIDAIPELNGFKTQRISPILGKLFKEDRVTKTVGKKGATYFKLA